MTVTVTPFTLAAQRAKWNEERMNDCHRAVSDYVHVERGSILSLPSSTQFSVCL